MSEFHDEYSESLDAEFRKLEDALLSEARDRALDLRRRMA